MFECPLNSHISSLIIDIRQRCVSIHKLLQHDTDKHMQFFITTIVSIMKFICLKTQHHKKTLITQNKTRVARL